LGRLEVNAVLGFIDFVLCLIPFDLHLYLQYSTYSTVKSGVVWGHITHFWRIAQKYRTPTSI
jgi:hypothetical protein